MSSLFGSQRYVWCTRLTPEECRTRLAKQLAPFWGFFGSRGRPLHGRVSMRGFDIVRFVSYRSNAQTHAAGTFQEWAGMMRIRVRVGPSVATQVSMAIFWGAFTVLGIFLALNSIPFGLLAGVIAIINGLIYGVLRWVARSEGDFLVGRLKEILEASDCTEETAV